MVQCRQKVVVMARSVNRVAVSFAAVVTCVLGGHLSAPETNQIYEATNYVPSSSSKMTGAEMHVKGVPHALHYTLNQLHHHGGNSYVWIGSKFLHEIPILFGSYLSRHTPDSEPEQDPLPESSSQIYIYHERPPSMYPWPGMTSVGPDLTPTGSPTGMEFSGRYYEAEPSSLGGWWDSNRIDDGGRGYE